MKLSFFAFLVYAFHNEPVLHSGNRSDFIKLKASKNTLCKINFTKLKLFKPFYVV